MFGQTRALNLIEKEEDDFDLDMELTYSDALRIQNLLNKITLLQVRDLTNLPNKETVYDEFLYIKPKVDDHFYLQTGLERSEFSHITQRLLNEAKSKLNHDSV